MLRLLEIGLFLVPFATFAVWRLNGGGAPSPALLGAAVGVMMVLAASLVWFSSWDTLGPGETYVPARRESGGRIVPGHAAQP